MRLLKFSNILFCWLLLCGSFTSFSQTFSAQEVQAWKKQAERITIIRDTWGIPHIQARTDADAVFGMLYTQCEDDFARVERNYLQATGRMAEAYGEAYVYHDLRTRLFTDTVKAIRHYESAEPWLKELCQAFAAGVNYYLYRHPEIRPMAIRRFQPWMPFLFSEGSIGTDIESVSLLELKAFYRSASPTANEQYTDDGLGGETIGNPNQSGKEPEPRGSNGFAFAPPITRNNHAILLINPHTTFYFRSEMQVTSREGLNAYGAVTWGQFFIYQGFNEFCGWMHTSSAADAIDEYAEVLQGDPAKLTYLYGKDRRSVTYLPIKIKVKTPQGWVYREFTGLATHHGPIVARRGDHAIAVRLMDEPVKALTQSFRRTKARNYEEFSQVMELRTNSSNNTVFADKDGNIAYWHGNFVPRRNPQFDWSQPVDGTNPDTEWQGLHTLDELVSLHNPGNFWIQNCNSTPFTASPGYSPDPARFPAYMAPDPENPRGTHAIEVLSNQKDLTLDKVISLAYDSHLPAFDALAPSLVRAFEEVALVTDSFKRFTEPVELLRKWDRRFSAQSIETTLAIYWAQQLRADVESRLPEAWRQWEVIQYLHLQTSPLEKVQALSRTIRALEKDFGSWRQPWGNLNRFQRLSNTYEPEFDDSRESLAIPFTSAFWGSLASFGSRRYPNTRKMYGNVGNSFVAVVEFGPKVQAKAIMTGGSAGSPDSPHFNDQSLYYQQMKFRDVLFYPAEIKQHTERMYRPGE